MSERDEFTKEPSGNVEKWSGQTQYRVTVVGTDANGHRAIHHRQVWAQNEGQAGQMVRDYYQHHNPHLGISIYDVKSMDKE